MVPWWSWSNLEKALLLGACVPPDLGSRVYDEGVRVTLCPGELVHLHQPGRLEPARPQHSAHQEQLGFRDDP